jgi:hypothetical protein
MRVITRGELAHCTKTELDGLIAIVLREISYARQGSPEWYAGMASLDNIRQAQAARNAVPRPRGPGF